MEPIFPKVKEMISTSVHKQQQLEERTILLYAESREWSHGQAAYGKPRIVFHPASSLRTQIPISLVIDNDDVRNHWPQMSDSERSPLLEPA
jgi:hypothetical protein